MAIKLSALPPELRRRLLAELNPKAAPARPRLPRTTRAPSGLMRVCSCGFEIFRPDESYPEECDGCGCRWPT